MDAIHLGLPDGAMLLGVMKGNLYASTARDGSAGHIAVNEASLRIA